MGSKPPTASLKKKKKKKLTSQFIIKINKL